MRGLRRASKTDSLMRNMRIGVQSPNAAAEGRRIFSKGSWGDSAAIGLLGRRRRGRLESLGLITGGEAGPSG